MRPPAWIVESGSPRILRLAHVGVAVDVGPSLTKPGATDSTRLAPIIEEPTIITHGDAMQYISTIDDLATCLDRDARDHLIYFSPGKLRADAQNLFDKATAIDGCAGNPNLCPHPDEDPKPMTPSEIKNRVLADGIRTEGKYKIISAEAIEARAKERGLTNDAASNAQVSAEIDFYGKLAALRRDIATTYTEVSSATITGSSDWKKIAILDVRYQTLRDRYTALGFSPSCAIPRLDSSSGLATWIKILLVLLGVGVGAYAIGQAAHLIGSRP